MQAWESPLLQDRTFSVDSIRIKRRNMVNELHRLRSLDHGMRQQMAELTKQENALKSAVHSEETSRPEAGARGRENRQALSSSVFPAAFPGARAGLSVCEPWPACCPTGDADNCYGVVSAGVLGAHACTPYPMCCGTDTHNCFDQVSVGTMPSTSVVDATPQDISELEAVCEGAEQLKQCLAQTQRCMSPNPQGDFANTCTCFSSSLYCSYPQTPEDCSPCPMACQQQIYDWYKTSQTDDGGSTIQCPLFEKGQVGDDVTALDDGSFRPYEWYSDKELHPKSYSRILPAGKGPVETPPIHIKWPELEHFHYPKESRPDPLYIVRPYVDRRPKVTVHPYVDKRPIVWKYVDRRPKVTVHPYVDKRPIVRKYVDRRPKPTYIPPRPPVVPQFRPYRRRPHADRPKYTPPHQPTWSNYVNPLVAEREYVEAPYSYSFPHSSAIPPHMIDGYDMNKHVMDA